MTAPLRSPLHARHEALGASFTPFGAWDMPLKYGNELAEHRAVRESTGLFDLSHMGEIRVTGPEAGQMLDYALLSTLSSLKVGKAKYSMIVAADGGIIDDLITYRLGEEEFLVVPNAGNSDVVWAQFQERAEGFEVQLRNESLETALIAIQGPGSQAILEQLSGAALPELGYYSAIPLMVAGLDCLCARTGYTGEDGFELFLPAKQAEKLWDAIVPLDVLPCGLAARDSLRLEAAMPLYGNELTRDITPVEAGMGRAFATKEAEFVGKQALTGRTPSAYLTGLKGSGRRAARAGAQVFVAGTPVGRVTSGQLSPTLGEPIALALLDRELAPGTAVSVDIRGREYEFQVVETPFYQRAKN